MLFARSSTYRSRFCARTFAKQYTAESVGEMVAVFRHQMIALSSEFLSQNVYHFEKIEWRECSTAQKDAFAEAKSLSQLRCGLWM